MKNHSCLFIGLSTVDLFYNLNKFPLPDSKNNSTDVKINSGGPAANAAITFSFLGGKSKLVSSIGKHSVSSIILDDLKTNKIDFIDLSQQKTEVPLLSSILISDSGKRTIITAKPKDPIDSDEYKNESIKNFDSVMTDGFFPEAALFFAKEARQNNIPVIFDGGSWKDKTEILLPYVTDAICSSNFLPPGLKIKEDILNYLLELGVERAAITDNEKEIIYKTGEESGKILPPKIEAVDTSAAGDVFHGAYIYFYLKYSDFKTALIKASETASESCRFFGSREWMNI